MTEVDGVKNEGLVRVISSIPGYCGERRQYAISTTQRNGNGAEYKRWIHRSGPGNFHTHAVAATITIHPEVAA